MALFGKRSALERLVRGEWKDEAEKLALLSALRDESGVKAGDLLPLVWSPDATLRQSVAPLFVARADARAVTAFVGELQGKAGAARAFGFRVMARLKPEVLGPAIDALLKHSSPLQQRFGWEVAVELPVEVVGDYLERALREAPGPIRLVALNRIVQERGGPLAARAALIEFATHPDDRIRERAIELLASLGGQLDDAALDLLLERFLHDNAAVKSHCLGAVRALARSRGVAMRPRFLKLLSEGDDGMRRAGAELLFLTGEPAEVVQEILVHCRSLLGWLRTRILNTLQTFGDDVLRPAVTLLEHPDEEVRMQALVLCEHFEDKRLVGPVVKLLDDPDWWLRVTACETLSKLKDPRVVPQLIKALDDEDTRWAAIDALGSIGGDAALGALVKLLGDGRPEVRLEAAQVCARSGAPSALDALRRLSTQDPSQEVRTRLLELLRERGDHGGLDERATAAVTSSALTRPLDRLLAEARERGASDIQITVDEPPMFRLHGQMFRTEHPPWRADETRAAVLEVLDPARRRAFEAAGEVDFCHAIAGVGRYRANAFVQRKGTCAAFRAIPNLPPTFAELRLPGQLTELLDYHQGLILVSGPAGGGKSTTLAAILNLINETKSDHIITLEDPIEFVHPVKSSLVNQREVSVHTESFARALRAALREDPDVIMVGEMRDVETVRMALMAAETGHLVVATLHTTSAVATVDRLVESFPPDEQAQVRIALSESLKYVVSQSLVPRADGAGRVAVYEVLKGTMNVSTLIRENKTFQLPSLMQISRAHGMVTLDQSLEDLLNAGLISAETAWARAEKKELFEGRLPEGSLSA
ncbi:MAG: PilT/PilU family type 4a pilus ATPase [Myxococcales bacterium]|nr:PilT/PilU family type 4a pilus ATPase [Myxococcales bacterium]